jgi:hypothetical protein
MGDVAPALRGGAITLALMLAAACGSDTAMPSPAAYPSAGLYTPGNTLGASDPTDTPVPGAGLGDRCVALPPVPDAGAGAPTAGTLMVTYQTQTLHGRYAPRNCTAAWVETGDGAYVATLELTAGLRRPGLVYFQDHACTEKLGPDVITSATRTDHTKPHMAMWSGQDFAAKPVADGPYKLFIEVTESDKEPGVLSEFDFVKGAAPFDMDAPVDVDGPLVSVKLAWMPKPEGSAGAAPATN